MTLNRGYGYREQVGAEATGRRVRDHLAVAYRHSAADVWDTRLQAGEVDLDGLVACGDEILRGGQQLVWHRPPWDEPDVPLTFDLLHEDGEVLAVSKPSGLPTMPAGGFLEHTLFTLVRVRFGEVSPVHRLGRFTSGLVVFARTRDAAAALARSWRAREVTKDYRALIDGEPAWDTREITTPIGPVPHPTLGSVHAASGHGRPACSVATVVERREGVSLVDVRITTGRPHQIRIHMAAAGHPLTGDPLYELGGCPRAVEPGLPGDGGYLLHAHRLRLAHPGGAGTLALEASPPWPLSPHGRHG